MTLLLVRHTEVSRAWRGRCYGSSDTGLSRAGEAHARVLALELAAWRPDIVVHSDLRRARLMARRVADLSAVEVRADPAWRERDFGDWEGRSWAAIYRTTGDAMDGMIDAPDSFRPGGGETTRELADRIRAAWAAVPAGRVMVITHGGPIAVVRAAQVAAPVSAWARLIPALGEAVEIAREPR